MRDVNWGWLLRYSHAVGASMFFVAVYIHMFRGLYYGSYKAPREMLWILGVLILLLMIATAFMGYSLAWGQMSFWAVTVITNLFSSLDVIPGSARTMVQWIWGGFAVGEPTLNRLFSLHYLFPFVIAGVVVLHIWALHVPGNNNPTGIDVKSGKETVPFHPYYTIKDGFALVAFILVFASSCSTRRTGSAIPTTMSRPIRSRHRRTSCRNGTSCRSTRFCAPSRTSCSASSRCCRRSRSCSSFRGSTPRRCARPAIGRSTNGSSGRSWRRRSGSVISARSSPKAGI